MILKNLIKRITPVFLIDFIKYKPFLSDKKYIEKKYKKDFGKKIDLENPQTFNEKLQWLKLYDRRPEYSKMVDKYEVKKYVTETIGEQYVIPTLGVWDKFEDINFDLLPNQFVLKCTHDSGGLVIVKDKSKFNKKIAQEKISASLKRNYYLIAREWPYKNVKPRIIAEKYLEDLKDGELRDYKFYTFRGEPKSMLLATNRQSNNKELSFDYFDMEGNLLNLTNYWHPHNTDEIPHIPLQYKKMQELCRVLAKNIPHVRVDFYEVNGKIFFGELTFYDMGGFLKLEPETWDKEWGSLIDLPTNN